MWDDSRHVTRQILGIGNLLAERLAAAGIDHLCKLQDADPRRIETVTQRQYPFGEHATALLAGALSLCQCFSLLWQLDHNRTTRHRGWVVVSDDGNA